MNSDLTPSHDSSNSNTSQEMTTNQLVSENKNSQVEEISTQDNSSVDSHDFTKDQHLANRQQPIPPPSELMQYRAIGLVRGRYITSSEQFTQGSLLTSDGVILDSVLLGRIMSLVKNHLDLEKEHLWVVYPRTRQKNDQLHLQIVGVWEPEKLAKQSADIENQSSKLTSGNLSEIPTEFTPSSEFTDGGFSVRGEIVYQSDQSQSLVVKIRQSPRKSTDKPKYFKLKVKGTLDIKATEKFWDLQLQREGDALVLENAEVITDLPKTKRPPFKQRFKSGKKPFRKYSSGVHQRPFKKSGDVSETSKTLTKSSLPKPVKRSKQNPQ
ncbi:FIG00870833: hypothetical protein [Richelia intracellularis HH01]|uniref:Slr1122 protein n=1 Tax=Richelia intracellularis HH01 TaxID=1165094 RepID=M1WST9_9NOST|nr:hypothetical protein [Richelia intracellularis]CCH67644.1 FIG00870833: hypothetical protein [Richelia intracellularis HH01]